MGRARGGDTTTNDRFTTLLGTRRGSPGHPEDSRDLLLEPQLVLVGVSADGSPLIYENPDESDLLRLRDGSVLARYVPEKGIMGRRPLIATAPVLELYRLLPTQPSKLELLFELVEWHSAELVAKQPMVTENVLDASTDFEKLRAWVQARTS